MADGLANGSLTTRAWGRRKNITVLFAGIEDFASFGEANEPAVVFETLNVYLQAIIEPVMKAKGLVDNIAGDQVSSLFGVVTADEPPPVQAVRAAIDVLGAARDVNAERKREGSPILRVRIGIATGLAALGILGTRARRTFSAIGHHVSLARGLMCGAGADEILVDANTYEKIGIHQDLFQPREATVEGLKAPIGAFSHNLQQ